MIRPQDVSTFIVGEHYVSTSSNYQQKKSKELYGIIKGFNYHDAYIEFNQINDFTWSRQGSRASRLDQIYLPPDIVPKSKSCKHILHLSDHKAVLLSLSLEISRPNVDILKEKSFWKLNSRVLEDKNFDKNFKRVLLEIMDDKDSFGSTVEWFESSFRKKVRDFLIDFSKVRQKSRRDTRALMSSYLQRASQAAYFLIMVGSGHPPT